MPVSLSDVSAISMASSLAEQPAIKLKKVMQHKAAIEFLLVRVLMCSHPVVCFSA
jgi:hypothetical protein